MIKVKFELNENLHTLGEYDNKTNKFTFKKDKYTPYKIWNELKESLLNNESSEIIGK